MPTLERKILGTFLGVKRNKEKDIAKTIIEIHVY